PAQGQAQGRANIHAGKHESSRVTQDGWVRFTSAKHRKAGQNSVGVDSLLRRGQKRVTAALASGQGCALLSEQIRKLTPASTQTAMPL
ncbi:hypothetical protein M0F12_24400, partial [Ralstonia solanacearum]|uniref:hypothetical protein n=1 Tax=Ralstonia solanacearum TaxID=305 RepID=UPI002029BDE0